jgi:hypothetical protein
MSGASDSICIYCNQRFQLDGSMNRTADGRPCPICAERLLGALPPLIPAAGRAAAAGEYEELEEDQERAEPVRVRPLRGPRPTGETPRRPRLARPADDLPEPA